MINQVVDILNQNIGKINIKELLLIITNNNPKNNDSNKSDDFFSPREFSKLQFESILNDNLDADSLRKIEEIREDLNALYHKKQLLYVLPILKKMLDEYSDKIVFDKYKPIVITDDKRILISQFNDLEVEFNALTKAVYILFCQNPNGINIKELSKHKIEILVLYTEISRLLDFNLIMSNIEELISSESKAIYTHISRIKSTFYKIMDQKYANNYIITSDSFGSDYKYIPILKNN